MPHRKHTPDDLFLLVKSLTKSEKRYFKIHAAPDQAGTNYMQLFDLLNEQDEYNEAKFKEAMKGKMRVNNFHVAKRYLFDLILKTLMNFYAEDSIDIKIKQQILKIDILNKKSLFDVSYKQLKQIEKLARKYDKHIYLTEIYSLMKNNVIELLHGRYSGKDVEEIMRKETENHRQIENKMRYKNLLLEVFKIQMEHRIKSRNEALNKIRAMTHHPLLRHESSATTFDSRLLFNNINSYVHKESGNLRKSEAYFRRYIRLLESRAHILKFNKANYLGGLYNYAILLREMKKFRQLSDTLDKAMKVEPGSPSGELLQFRNYYQLRLGGFIDAGNYKEALRLEPEIQAGFRKHKGKLDKMYVLNILYYLAYAHYKSGNYGNALELLAEVINTPRMDALKELFFYARLLQWICHFEGGERSSLHYLAQSLDRFTDSHGMEGTPESLLVKNLLLLPEKISDKHYLLELRAVISKAFEGKRYKVSEYMDIRHWLDTLQQNSNRA